MCCYSTGHRRWEIWCHSSFRRRVKPLQHVGQSTASYRHLSYGQLLSLHAWQRGAVGRCQRGGIWRCHKSSIGDLWRPSLWFLRTRLSVWKHSRYRGNTRPDIALRTYRETKTETHVYIFSHNGLFRPLFCFMFVETLLSAWPKTKMTDCEKRKWKKKWKSVHIQGQNPAEANISCWYIYAFLCVASFKNFFSPQTHGYFKINSEIWICCHFCFELLSCCVNVDALHWGKKN